MTGTRKSVTNQICFCVPPVIANERFALASRSGRQVAQVRAELFAPQIRRSGVCAPYVRRCCALHHPWRLPTGSDTYRLACDTLDYGRKDIPETIVVVLTIDSFGLARYLA
jgi:hypothetical protein